MFCIFKFVWKTIKLYYRLLHYLNGVLIHLSFRFIVCQEIIIMFSVIKYPYCRLKTYVEKKHLMGRLISYWHIRKHIFIGKTKSNSKLNLLNFPAHFSNSFRFEMLASSFYYLRNWFIKQNMRTLPSKYICILLWW